MQPVVFADAQRVTFGDAPPAEAAGNVRSWHARGQNFLVEYAEVKPGSVLARAEQPDEYAIVLPDSEMALEIETPAERASIGGFRIAFVPPGESRVHVGTAGRVVRVFTTMAQDLVAKCSNAAAYAERHPNLPEFVPLPPPPGGYRIRSYSLAVPPQEGRVGRIFACTTLMINFANPRLGPATGTTRLSPHSHDDFEQGTLILDGSFVHHLRWPWGNRRSDWRDDEHVTYAAHSMVVIPAGVLHCSEAAGEGTNQFLDVWAPPRLDYFDKGHVLNRDDYLPRKD